MHSEAVLQEYESLRFEKIVFEIGMDVIVGMGADYRRTRLQLAFVAFGSEFEQIKTIFRKSLPIGSILAEGE